MHDIYKQQCGVTIEHNGSSYPVAPATNKDVGSAMGVIQARIDWLKAKGVEQWQYKYLERHDKEFFEKQVDAGNLYVVKDGDGVVVATFLLTVEKDPLWDGVRDDEEGMYFGKLATSPNPTHAGLGRRVIDSIKEIASSKGAKFLRADFIKSNDTLREYYLGQGFEIVGEVDFPDGHSTEVLIEHPLKSPNKWQSLTTQSDN